MRSEIVPHNTPPRAALWLRLIVLTSLFFLIGCQPKDERPGMWLTGERSAIGIVDWSFGADAEEVFIETRPWYGIRHSTTIWCVVLDNVLYVGSYGDEKKSWENNIARNNEARISADGVLYDVYLTPVSDKKLGSALDAAYNAKYDMVDVFGEDVPPWWYYRVAQSEG